MKVNLSMKNIVKAKADTQDKGCYSDKAEKLAVRRNTRPYLKKLTSKYKEDS